MIDNPRRELRDWEWRDAEYRRRRARAARLARRRDRLRLIFVVLFLGAVVVCALLAARAVALPSPYAHASLALVGDRADPVKLDHVDVVSGDATGLHSSSDPAYATSDANASAKVAKTIVKTAMKLDGGR